MESVGFFSLYYPYKLIGLTLLCLTLIFARDAVADQQSNNLIKAAASGKYSAPGLYAPTYKEFDNGLKLVSLQREHATAVTLKVRVDVGKSDFLCGEQEIPHALEHMVYGGLSTTSESELEKRFWELGIDSNAYVSA